MNSKKSKSGLALIIILLILVCLTALGLPFVISMLTKEKSMRNDFYIAQSRYEAQACRNFAITSLFRTHDSYETRSTNPLPYNDPDYDTSAELMVDLSLVNSINNVTNPHGTIWGVAVQDEQGKVNLRTAPKSILRNLSNIVTKNSTINLRDFVTNYSYNSADWIESAELRGYAHQLLFNDTTVTKLYAKSLSERYSRSGARVRLSNGTKQFFAYVMPSKICTICGRIWSFPIGDHSLHALPPEGSGTSLVINTSAQETWFPEETQGNVMLDRLVPDDFLSPFTILEVAQLCPININTAPDEVIVANLLGLGSSNIDQDDRITEDQSKQLTDLIRAQVKSGGFKDTIDYYNLISSAYQAGIITSIQQLSLIKNNSGACEFYDFVNGYFTATLPFCVRSYDKYTIISTGITNYPSGAEAAGITNREIVDITPPGTNLWRIESQYDFDREFSIPYGNATKFTTYPNKTLLGGAFQTDPALTNSLPEHSRATDAGELKLKSVDDNRGNNPILIEHFSDFSDTHEGKELIDTPISYPASTIFTFQNDLDILPGGIEMWVKINELTTPIYFFDIKQNDYENRISLWYTGSELVLSVSDATIAGKAAQIHAPMFLQPNIWYHLGAYWKGTKYAQLALFVDGRPVGSFAHYDGANNLIITELTAELTDQIAITTPDGAGLIISAISTDAFPSSGVLEIGDEAIGYSAKITGGFRVTQVWQANPQQGQPDILVYHGRGKRGTTVKKHPAGSKITIYGYSNILRNTINLQGYPVLYADRLTTGGATLVEPLLDHMPIVSIFKPEVRDALGNIIQEGGINASDTTIPVTPTGTCNITEFPSNGYIRINNEVISYSGIGTTIVWQSFGITATVSCFTGCVRGSLTTTATLHQDSASVILYSFKVTNNQNYLDRTIIQMGNEWLGPLQRQDTNYFVGIIEGGYPRTLTRGLAWTTPTTQTAGTELIPVFAVNNPYCGNGDTVTIIESDQTKPKEEQVINLARSYFNQHMVAFTQNVTREYLIDGLITRLLKFPSDELPSYLPATFYIGSAYPSQGEPPLSFQGMIDEIRLFRTVKGDFKLNNSILSNIPASGNSIIMNNVSGLAVPGIIKVGDELIGYVNADTYENFLTGCHRGYLNSSSQVHASGERAMALSFLPIVALTADIFPNDYNITFTTSSTLLPEGYLLADNELIGYCWEQNYGVSMPYDRNRQGIYRGAFGTNPDYHNKDTLLFAMPFRYFDRYKTGAFDTSMAYFQSATKMTNAKWQRIRWDNGSSTLPGVRIKILARFNGKPAWDTQPTNKEDGIFEFTNLDSANAIGVEGDQIELLTFFEYLPGAFPIGSAFGGNSNDWKRSPVLRGIWVEYEKPNLILSHEEK